jgi:hypothetical protein
MIRCRPAKEAVSTINHQHRGAGKRFHCQAKRRIEMCPTWPQQNQERADAWRSGCTIPSFRGLLQTIEELLELANHIGVNKINKASRLATVDGLSESHEESHS